MRILSVAMLTFALLLLAAAGCDGGRDAALPDLVPVSGTVTLDDKPLSGVEVHFMPVGSTRGGSSYGSTDASGRYELTVDAENKGAAVGEYQVLCTKWVMPDGSDFRSDSGLSPLESDAKELLPERYSQEDLTELNATVPAGGGTFDFKLTSEP